MSARRRCVMRAVLAPAALALAWLAPGRSATAQGVCTASGGIPAALGADACRKGEDLFRFLAPQLATALAGGNAVLGEGGTVGGLGHVSASLRVTALDGRLPDRSVAIALDDTPVSSNLGATRAPIPVPALDASIGLWRGVPVGLTNVGGVDLLVGMTFIPSVDDGEVRVRPDNGGVAYMIGARVGVLQESALVPGVAVSWFRRRLPSTTVTFQPDDDTLVVRDARVTAEAWRLTINKRFGLFTIGGGVGEDQLDARTSLEAIVNAELAGQTARGEFALDALQDGGRRRTAFVHAGFGTGLLQVVAEVGWSQAGARRDVLNAFDDVRVNGGYRYGSVGLRTRF